MKRRRECFGVANLFNLEGIEASANHKKELIAKDISCRPYFPLESIPFPKLPGLGIGASVPKNREFQRNQ